MTPERYARYDRALGAVGCDLYLSASSADIHYLTGSEDGNAFVIYRPGDGPTIVVRPGGYNCTGASARAREVVSFSLVDGPVGELTRQIQRGRPRRVAVGPLSGEIGQSLTARLSGAELVSAPRLGRDLRRIKEPEEIAALETAAACVGAGVEACFQAIRVGVSDYEAAAAACAAARRRGADTIGFLQVKAGPRSAFPDAEEIGRLFEADEIGFIDMGVRRRFYLGDYTRPFVIGEPPDQARRLVEVVDRIEHEALTILRPGLRCRDFYHQVRQLFADEGYLDAIPHHLGHGAGIGDDVVPLILPTSDDEFLEGEVVCVEPGVYVPGVGGARIEDTVVVRAGGNQLLSRAPRVGRCPAAR